MSYIFIQAACETFCVEETMINDGRNALTKSPLTEETVKFSKPSVNITLKDALAASYKKKVIACKVKKNKRLGDVTEDRETVFVDMQPLVSR